MGECPWGPSGPTPRAHRELAVHKERKKNPIARDAESCDLIARDAESCDPIAPDAESCDAD